MLSRSCAAKLSSSSCRTCLLTNSSPDVSTYDQSFKLDVNGAARIGSALFGTGSIDPSFKLDVNGASRITGTLNLGALSSPGGAPTQLCRNSAGTLSSCSSSSLRYKEQVPY